ncbi:zinc ribbon domain-containing protein [Methanobacterium sp. YSL]|nr:zinc ribbon domain-containing protein [Methanobacterium sp. YSL]
MENGLEVCSTCNAQIKPGSKFCTECGKPVEDQSHESKGKEIHDNEMAASTLNCPECNAELTAENQFCTECGAKLKGDIEGEGLGSIGEENREPITKCPKCNATIAPRTRFCTECGSNAYEYEPLESVTTVQTGATQTEITSTANSPSKPTTSRDDPLDEIKETGQDLMRDVEKTGKGLMKDLGNFLGKSSGSSSKKIIKPAEKEKRFLVCNKCGGYYELQKGESPDDFSQECDCGGHLEYRNQHP